MIKVGHCLLEYLQTIILFKYSGTQKNAYCITLLIKNLYGID